MLPPVSDVVKLPVIAMQREACELAEVGHVAAVLLVFKHIGNTAEVVGRIRGRQPGWRRAGLPESEPAGASGYW